MSRKEFYCYHITTKDRLPDIMKLGLLPNSVPGWFRDKTPYIMLSLYPYWWLYQNRLAWGLPEVNEADVVLIEIKSPYIKRKYFDDPEGLRWDKPILPKYFNVVVNFTLDKEWQALKTRILEGK